MDEDEQQQERVIKLINQIMAVLAGIENAEAHTALTFSVVCAIVSVAADNEDCKKQARMFTDQVNYYASHPEFLEWARASMHHLTATKTPSLM